MTTSDPKADQLLGGLAQQARYVHDFAKAGQQTEALEHAGAVERLITAWRLAAGHADRDAIHLHFSLSYANYLVLPRTLLQSMPDEWQARFVGLLDELDDAFQHVPQADAYEVTAGSEHEVFELDEAERKLLGITADWYQGEKPPPDLPADDLAEWEAEHENPDGPKYYDREGQELSGSELVLVPSPDPVPHYNRGRTRIEPQLHRCNNCEGVDPASCLLNAGPAA